jgi:hypothetical protein
LLTPPLIIRASSFIPPADRQTMGSDSLHIGTIKSRITK